MRYRLGSAVLVFLVSVTPGYADHAPTLVIPGRPGVPVVVDGVEVSGAVIEGHWGLHRPGAGVRTIYPEYDLIGPEPAYRYFPFTGRVPRYGRHEIITRSSRGRPTRAQSYHRFWGTHVPLQVPAVPDAEEE